MTQPPATSATGDRFEVLPFGRSQEEAAQLPEPVRLTVTCSPRHGPDHSVEVAARLHALGHAVTVHLAARMVRDRTHLDQLLAGMRAAGADDLFLIGGDAASAAGAYASAVDLLPVIAAHSDRPATIGIAGYPEGHPLIEAGALRRALHEKSRLADYVTTQLCFDPDALRRWIGQERSEGLTLPVLVGLPGRVTAARLMEMSARIGVGTSRAFLRKQRGLSALFGLVRRSASDRLYDALAGDIGEPRLGIAGFHYFTFNRLTATYEWQRRKAQAGHRRRPAAARAPAYAHPQESKP